MVTFHLILFSVTVTVAFHNISVCCGDARNIQKGGGLGESISFYVIIGHVMVLAKSTDSV